MSEELKVCPVEQVVGPSGENLAAFIREINGDNRMGAGALAERISEWLARAALSAGSAVPGGQAIELLSRLRAMINCTPENDTYRCGVWISTRHPVIERIDALLAAAPTAKKEG